MAAPNIARVEARGKLRPRREPYWIRCSAGQFLGFRKMTADSAGAWVARSRDADTGRQRHTALGEYLEHPAHTRFDLAKRDADAWFSHLGLGGTTEAVTVRKACELYVEHVLADRGERPASDLRMRFKRWVYGEPSLADINLSKLTKTRIEAWRKAMAKTPAKVSRDRREKPLTRSRAASSVNRDMAALRAALNFAHDAGNVTSDMAWRVALRPTKNADGRRDLYLDRDQRRALIRNAEPGIATLLQCLSLLPLRPGALAALTVASLDKRLGVLAIGHDKAGKARKIKLPAATAKVINELSQDKLPGAPLLSRADGRPWTKDDWKWPIKDAAAKAELPSNTTAYTLRHSVITDLVTGGLDLLTIAQISGTSVAMIEKHYGHLRADHAAAALATLAL